jgi:hypothetical protein
MFCKNCGTQLGEDDKFCSACGTPVATGDAREGAAPAFPNGNNRPEPRKQRNQQNGHRRPFIPDPEALAQLNRFLAKKTKLKRVIAWPIAALCALYALFCLYVGEIGGVLLGLAFTLAAFFSAFTQSYLSVSQYKSLPGSSTESGKPRCVHCGHVGLYTHGKYKSAAKYHDCSRCGVNLYTS